MDPHLDADSLELVSEDLEDYNEYSGLCPHCTAMSPPPATFSGAVPYARPAVRPSHLTTLPRRWASPLSLCCGRPT